MPARHFLIVRTADQWLRGSHVRTSLDREHGILQLANVPSPDGAPIDTTFSAGLAFDRECRLYRAVPEGARGNPPKFHAAQVDRYLWATFALEPRSRRRLEPAPLLEPPAAPTAGEFEAIAAPALRKPRALAVDADNRLFIADTALRTVVVVDLLRRRIVRHVQFAPTAGELISTPIDLAVHGRRVWVLLDDPVGLALLRSRRPVRQFTLPPGATRPSRLAAAGDGRLVVLDDPGTAEARIITFSPARPEQAHISKEPFATDLEFDCEGTLVIARRPGENFVRVRDLAVWERTSDLQATDFDGAGIVRVPDGRIGFWTIAGRFRYAISARPRYAYDGRVTTYRLDSGTYQTVWGRLFVEACIPSGTEARVRAVSADEPPDGPTQPEDRPANIDKSKLTLLRPELSPPLLPLELDHGPVDGELFKRPRGRELPWSFQLADDRFETYESPVRAGRGRFLWVTIELRGNGRATPRIRSLRVEHPSHDYLQRLPKTFSRDAAAESFLRRFLAPLEGALGEFESRAIARMVLVDARSAPEDVLPWLASFVGLVLDERIEACRKRRIVASAAHLLRLRGTRFGLIRFVQLATGIRPHIVEHFTLRGFGGPVLGYTGADMPTRSVLGSGFRIGGSLDQGDNRPLAGTPIEAIRRRAHRFTLILPAAPSADQRAVVEHILQMHRPAHTIGDFCTAEAGMRTGIGLHVGMTTVVGETARFMPALLGDFALGRGVTVGQAVAGTRPAAGRLGVDTRVG